ncbi:protocadherin Fat 4-like, partial [Paramuricea clavata]
DKISCADKNECLDGSEICINANCKNTDGSYECKCLYGYQPSSNRRRCEMKSCTPLTAPQCPADAYRDEFGRTCMPIKITCHDGYKYQQSCTLSCVDNYKLAVIAQPNFRQKFAENFTTVDFGSPSDRTLCTVDSNSRAVIWDWNPVTTPYYCRRVNDPPLGVTISKTVINEKESFLTPAGKLSATDPQKDHLIFSILNPEGNYYFLIQGNMLLVKNRLVWSHNLGDNTHRVVVNVSDNGSPMMHSKATHYITVLNINDPPYGLELSNNELVGNVPMHHTVGNLTAIDDDVGPRRTSNFSWEIVDTDNGLFSLRGNEILTAKSLDQESKNVHRIQLKCTDYGIPRKSSQVVNMFINVRNCNDCQKYIYLTNHSVSEKSQMGTPVGDIMATVDDNDTLSFDLQGIERRDLRKFALQGSATCALRLQDGKPIQTCSVPLVVNGSLDYEMENEFFIWVAVTDAGGASGKRFRIEVENVNERPTDILISDDRVPENSPGRTVVGEFLVQDPDNKIELTQSHTCSLVNSSNGDEDAFYIAQTGLFAQRNLLRIKTNRILDFETKKMYNITVFCKDKKLGISKQFLIKITDVNEAPTSLVLSSTSVEESQSNMINIATLSAKDPDGMNQAFTYTVRDSQSFRIGGTNQDQLFFLGPLHFEHTPSISVHLRVTDNGGLYLEKIFTIMVQDVNDPPTDIRLHPADAKLSENSVQNVFITQLEMIDLDSNTKASCKLQHNSNGRVNLISMILVVGPTITDYESLGSSKSLQILVRCEDQHGASVTRWINLPVEDVNEAPTSLTLSKLEIRENKNDTVVGILEISDPDVGQRHSCTILDVDTPFYIDTSTNSLTLKTVRPLDFESSRVQYVNINCEDIVPDHRQAQLFIDKQFKINVLDVNEAPQILCNTSFLALPSFSRGSILGQIQHYDPDNERYHISKKQNPNGPFEIRKQLLSYRFENENIAWRFDVTQNGIIYLKKRPTAEKYNNRLIMFGIRVDDDGLVWERKNGSEEYRIKKDEAKYSVQKCSIYIA